MATPYRVNLPVYEGPLDLLLDLIRKQEMDIHNIPIAKVTEQYLDYLHQLEKLDIDVSADFIYEAATLIHIKSKMLVPPDPLAGPDGQEDPREELVHRLLEHEKFKNCCAAFSTKSSISKTTCGRTPTARCTREKRWKASWSCHSLTSSKCSRRSSSRRKEVTKFELHHETVTIAQMMDRLRQRLVSTEDPASR